MATREELTEFAATVRGVLGRIWPSSTAAPSASLDEVWAAAAQQGWMALAADDAADAAIAAVAELGRVACPLPLLDVFVARWLLGEGEVGDAIVAGAIRPVVSPPGPEVSRIPFVDGAAAASHVLVVDSDEARLHRIVERVPTPGMAVPSWATVSVDPAVEARVPLDAGARDGLFALLRVGLVARALGAARRAHELAIEHACTRHQFGRPIGSFQAVSQRAAQCHIELVAGELLVEEALRARAARPEDWLLASELAVAHGRGAASRVQFGAHHTFGAIGYFEEHEAPWLFRRVHADLTRLDTMPLRAGDAGDQLVEGKDSLPQLDVGPVAERFRNELRGIIAQHVPASRAVPTHDVDEGLIAALAEHGILSMTWPPEYGGRSASVEERLVFNEEIGYSRGGLGHVTTSVNLIAHALIRHGTEEQLARFLPPIRSGEMRICLGYSEPEAGSDLASLRTRAERDGDEWVINGQKLWTTAAHRSSHVWLATRTDPEAERPHAGITVFLVPLDTPGITMQQHHALGDEVCCSVFYDDVRVPDTARVGEVNGGWRVITDALALERVSMGGVVSRIRRVLDEILDLARRDVEGTVGPRGSENRGRVRDIAAKLQATRVLVAAAARATAVGGGARLEAPMAKVLGGEVAEEIGEAAVAILGPVAALGVGAEGSLGGFEAALRGSIIFVVGGGTNDIQRTLIARGLGLPR